MGSSVRPATDAGFKIKMTQILIQKPTKRTLDYLLILFNDCGFTINSRNVWLTNKFNRLFKYIDQLTPAEASQVIETLKEIRNGKK